MPTPLELKAALANDLGHNGRAYWRTLSDFLAAKISRVEFDSLIREIINSPELLQLHNSLLLSILTVASSHAGPAVGAGVASRKRRRIRAYQGPDSTDLTSSRSVRLKRWTVAAGKRERDRVRSLVSGPPVSDPHERDEVQQPRAIRLITEGKDQAGTFLPLRLCSTTRSITNQHLTERIALIAAQNDLSASVSKPVTNFLATALEAKLKNLITHALSQTSSSRTISSIRTSHQPSSTTLSASAFDTVFTLSPAVLPNQSAAATRLALGEQDYEQDRERTGLATSKGAKAVAAARAHEDPRWQLLTLLKERSAVREVLREVGGG